MANSNIVQLIKRIALDAVEMSKPCDYRIGTVTGVEPLKIKVSQNIELEEEFLHLSRNVTDFKTKITMEEQEVYHTAHTVPSLTWIDKQEVTVHNALKKGEKVLMLRKAGGQEFFVIDRVVE